MAAGTGLRDGTYYRPYPGQPLRSLHHIHTAMKNTPKTILALMGSARQASTNETILTLVEARLPEAVRMRWYRGLEQLPWFNPDLDAEGAGPPEAVADFRHQLQAADGLLIATPEYVFSLPGLLKNALEWLVSSMVLREKPAAFIVSAASGEQAFGSLDRILSTLVQQPLAEDCKLLVRGGRGLIAGGRFTDARVDEALSALVAALLRQMGVPGGSLSRA